MSHLSSAHTRKPDAVARFNSSLPGYDLNSSLEFRPCVASRSRHHSVYTTIRTTLCVGSSGLRPPDKRRHVRHGAKAKMFIERIPRDVRPQIKEPYPALHLVGHAVLK